MPSPLPKSYLPDARCVQQSSVSSELLNTNMSNDEVDCDFILLHKY